MGETFTASDELDLRDYLRVLRRRKGIIALCVLVVVAGALVASFLQTPVYRAHTDLLLQSRTSEGLFDPTTGQQVRNPERAVQTEIQVIESEPVERAVEEALGVRVPGVRARVVGDTDVVRLAVEHTDPDQAAAIANAYAESYITFRRTQNVDDLLAAAAEIQQKVTELQTQIDALEGQLGGGGDGDGEAAADPGLIAQRDQLLAQQAVFRQQLDQLQVSAALKTGGASVVTPANSPDSPVRPTPLRSGVLAAVVGMVLGLGLAFLFDYLDDSVRDRQDLERATEGLPVLGMIPTVSDWKRADRAKIVSVTDPEGITAEAYRALRTSLQFLSLDRTLRSLQITSSTAGEGKTTTITNLAVLFARAGYRIVVIDCDLRRPRLHDFFGLSNQIGFTSVVLGEEPLSEAVQPVPQIPRLSILASGPVPPLPSELLSSYRTGEIIERLEAEYDLVLVDSPPAVPVTDATVLASWTDAVLLVATADMTSKRDFHRAAELLAQVEAPVVGSVLNRTTSEDSYGDRYGYRYRYGPREGTPRRGELPDDVRPRQRPPAPGEGGTATAPAPTASSTPPGTPPGTPSPAAEPIAAPPAQPEQSQRREGSSRQENGQPGIRQAAPEHRDPVPDPGTRHPER